MTSARLHKIKGVRWVALACATAAGAISSAAWANSAGAAISIGEPEGFSHLERQELLVDVFFGGTRRGVTRIVASRDALEIRDPAALDAMLGLDDNPAVASALAAHDLAANANLACGATSDRSTCGRLPTDVAGVILDRDNLRLDVFVNPRFLTTTEATRETWLSLPDRRVTFVNSVSALLAGQSGAGESYYNLQNHLVVGSGERRVRANLGYSSSRGSDIDTLAVEWDQRGYRYLAGAVWAPGSELSSRTKIVGFGLETQIDTRMDRELLTGSPVVVYLNRRARVDIFRDDHLVHSATYEAGNQQIDTSMLPDGSYPITIRIQEPGGPASESRQFFSKSRRLPSLGRTDFHAFGGLEVEDPWQGSITPSKHPYFGAGISHRISRGFALEASTSATRSGGTFEAAAVWITPIAQLRAAAIASAGGDIGQVLQVISAGSSRLNFNFDVRRVPASLQHNRGVSSLPAVLVGGLTQATGVVALGIEQMRLFGTGYYRRSGDNDAQYGIGPALEWDILQRGAATLTLRSDATITERGTAGFVGLALRLRGTNKSASALAGARHATDKEDPIGNGPVLSLAGAWSPDFAGGDLALGAGLERQARRTTAIASADYRGGMGSLGADISYNETSSADSIHYSLGVKTTVTGGHGHAILSGKSSTESMILARVTGARREDKFELLVNDHVTGVIIGGKTLTVALPSYRAYQLRIRSIGQDLVGYEAGSKRLGLYPGTVASVEWLARPIQVQFGRLLDLDGKPMPNASIFAGSTWSQTDGDGFFELEASEGTQVTILDRMGESFTLALPRVEGEIARLGDVRCCNTRRTRVASAGLETEKQK